MREILIAVALLSTGLAGCIGADDPGDAVSVAQDGNDGDEQNPWQAGLNTSLKTPDVALTASREERRSDVAPPGAPPFAAFDGAMESFLEAYDVPAASAAVLHDGKLRYENGYGHLDGEETEPANPQTMMRLASVTKPMTRAVIRLMIQEDRLAWDDPVFCVPPDPEPDCLLPIDPHPDRPVVDDRIADVELGHMVNHTSGWSNGDPDPCNDPIWSTQSIEVANELGATTPMPRWRMAQWGMGAELMADPGEEYAYCNVGYITLSLVAEAATGATMEAVYDAYLFRPLEISDDIQFGHALPEERNPREPGYACDHGKTPSVFDPDEEVCWADGGFSIHGLSGAGGLVATPAAVATFFDHYDFYGKPRPDGIYLREGSWGSMPGTATIAHTWVDDAHGEVQVVVLFDTRIGATPGPWTTPRLHWSQGLACANGYGMIRPHQCLAAELAKESVTVSDAAPAP